MNSSAKIVFLIVVAVTAVSASEEEFGVWINGPNTNMCLKTNLTMLGLTHLTTPTHAKMCAALRGTHQR